MFSAHRFFARHRAVDLAAAQVALAGLADDVGFVEIDVQLLADGTPVLWHDDTVAGRPVSELGRAAFDDLAGPTPRFGEVVEAVAQSRVGLHLDLKFAPRTAGPAGSVEVGLVAPAVAALGVDRVLVTTHHDDSVRAVAQWAHTAAPGLRVGLSVGRGLGSVPWRSVSRLVRDEVLPTSRLRSSGATAVVAHRRLAHLTAARAARRLGLPLVVWTVDSPRGLRHWQRRAWLVVTNRR